MGEVGVVWWAMQKLLMMDDWEVWEVLEVEFVSGARNVFVMNVFMVESSAVFYRSFYHQKKKTTRTLFAQIILPAKVHVENH